jgi:hypothetical protein
MDNSNADVVSAEVIFVAFSNISMVYTAYNFVNLFVLISLFESIVSTGESFVFSRTAA